MIKIIKNGVVVSVVLDTRTINKEGTYPNMLNLFESAFAWKLVADSNITWKQENCKICTSYSILSRWKEVITGV